MLKESNKWNQYLSQYGPLHLCNDFVETMTTQVLKAQREKDERESQSRTGACVVCTLYCNP